MCKEILELLEGVSAANSAFIKSEISLNDGDIEGSQKYSKEGQTLVKSMIKDTFQEVKEEFELDEEECNDYDYPNNLELIKALNDIAMNSALYLSSKDDENISKIFKKKILQAINTAKEIFISLYEN